MTDQIPGKKIWQRSPEAAVAYDDGPGRFLLSPWAPDLLDAVVPKPGERALDVACGTGVVSRLALERVGPHGRVTGVDLHPDMLSVADRNARRRGLSIEWKEGDAASLPVSDSSVDVIVCQQGLQFFAEREAALQEMLRVLAPGGRVGILVWSVIEDNPYFLALANAVGRFVGSHAHAEMQSSFALGKKAELQGLMTAARFSQVHVERLSRDLPLPPLKEFIPSHLAGTSLAESVSALSERDLSNLVEDVLASMSGYGPDQEANVPFVTQLGRAARDG